MNKPLRVLIVEDSEDDALLTIRELKKGGYEPEYERVETAEAMRIPLQEKSWDIILCDYSMPKFSGPAAIALLKETGIDLPLIIVSGAIGEETAVDCMRFGARDYVMKGNLFRLVSAIERELREAESRRQRKQAEDALRESEIRYRELFDNMGSGVAVYEARNDGKDFVFKDYNAAAGMLDKTPRGQAIGRSVVDVFPGVKEFGLLDVFQRVYRTGKAERHPVTFYKDEKISGWRENYVYKLSSGEIVAVFEDTTNQKRAEDELQKALESLRKSFSATVQVLVSAVETRDPYTAGHQTRSADLARTIATEMGLPQNRIDGIRMAGAIHDIGKMSVPAEILSKPTKLTELEFSLIKEHANKGFEMLKDVDSPWPLAEIVHQHHERMDGSGYPRQLKGEEIIMEARILAVADVVESMASHRPYRPALGVNAALAEIENNKGTLYDADAVDVCLRLFSEKDYKFE